MSEQFGSAVFVLLCILWCGLSASTCTADSTDAAAVAVFRQPGFPAPAAASSPKVLEGALRKGGFQVEYLDAAQLADPATLVPERYAVLVLPYGESFPTSAREAFLAYLKKGGHFVSTGGYAFENLLDRAGDTWVPHRLRVERDVAQALAAENQLLADPGFENSENAPSSHEKAGYWRRPDESCKVVRDNPFEGDWCAHVKTETGKIWTTQIEAKPNARYRIVGRMRWKNVCGYGFAYAAVYQYGSKGDLVRWKNCFFRRGTSSEWHAFSQGIIAHPDAARIEVQLGIWNASGQAWYDDVRLNVVPALPTRMNTSMGEKGGAGSVAITPGQLAIFDIQHPLDRVARVTAETGQFLFPYDLELDGAFTGWAATALQGRGNSRWVPLLSATDRLGRPRGPAGAMLLNHTSYARQQFAGSTWAFFGLDNVDLFDGSNEALMKGFVKVVRFLARGLHLMHPRTNYAHYHAGEKVEIKVPVVNVGRTVRQGTVKVHISADGRPGTVFNGSAPFSVAPGSTSHVTLVWQPKEFDADLYEATCTLELEGEPIDLARVGFTAASDAVLAEGPEFSFEDNYIKLDGKPTFLFGADDITVPANPTQHPGIWAKDLVASRDCGLRLFEVLPFLRNSLEPTEADLRALESQAQLTQKYGLVYMPGLLIGHNAIADNERMEREREKCRSVVSRLKETPAIIWYINGDIVLSYDRDQQAADQLWNDYLKGIYKTDRALAKAWGRDAAAPGLGKLTCPPPASSDWDNRPLLDLSRFDIHAARRWMGAQEQAIHTEDPEHPTCSEYVADPHKVDMVTMVDGNDIADTTAWAAPDNVFNDVPARLKWNDMRSSGHSASIGEYGFPTHPAYYPPQYQTSQGRKLARLRRIQHTICLGHVSFATGYSKIQQWCFKDFSTYIMPWGAFYMNQQLPKPETYANRNQSLLFSSLSPKYVTPPVTLLLPDNLRKGVLGGVGLEAGRRAIQALLEMHADFCVLNDGRIDSLSDDTRLVVYPVPFCPDDDVVPALERFVRNGGTLILTGDISYDANRKPGSEANLTRLAGVVAGERRYPNIRWQDSEPVKVTPTDAGFDLPAYDGYPCRNLDAGTGKVLARSGDMPVVVEHSLGAGTVIYSSDPYEIWCGSISTEPLVAFYTAAMNRAGVDTIPLSSDTEGLYAFRQPTTDGGDVWVVYNTDRSAAVAEARITTGASPIVLDVAGESPAMVALDGRKQVISISGSGSARVGDVDLVSVAPSVTPALNHVALRTLDGLDLRESKAVMILPSTPGKMTVGNRHAWRDPVLLVGEYRGGNWHTLEALPCDGPGPFAFDLDADAAVSVLILCEQADRARWERELKMP